MIRLFAVLAVVGGGLELGFHLAYSGHRRAVHRSIASLRAAGYLAWLIISRRTKAA
jgi:hypothetical protein